MTKRQELRDIIMSPMRSQVTTADIAVGMWSSTMLGEKLDDILAWHEQEVEKAVGQYKVKSIKAINILSEAGLRDSKALFDKALKNKETQ